MTKDLTSGERAMNWAKVLAIAVPSMIALYAAFWKGEPGAEAGYDRMYKEIAEVRKEWGKHKSFMDGFMEGQKQPRIIKREYSRKPRPPYLEPAPKRPMPPPAGLKKMKLPRTLKKLLKMKQEAAL